jgi:hypothetical protein
LRGQKEVEVKVRQAVNTSLKTGGDRSVFTAFSMLIGTLIAAVAAISADHRRDESLAYRAA